MRAYKPTSRIAPRIAFTLMIVYLFGLIFLITADSVMDYSCQVVSIGILIISVLCFLLAGYAGCKAIQEKLRTM